MISPSSKNYTSPNSKIKPKSPETPTPQSNAPKIIKQQTDTKSSNLKKSTRQKEKLEKLNQQSNSRLRSSVQSHQAGYTGEQIKLAVDFIFRKYDSNNDGMLTRDEVKCLIEGSLKFLGSSHSPNQLEIVEFIYSMDKNNDGKLSKGELEAAFLRANRVQY